MGSFVQVKDYKKLEALVIELQGRIQALETFHQGEPLVEKAAEPIPDIEEAIEENLIVDEDPVPSLESLFGSKIADLLISANLDGVYKVESASDERLQAISGIGAATVINIREILEGAL
jgi:hypothetical protein